MSARTAHSRFRLAGEIQARGKTVEQVRSEITQRLVRYVPDLVVTVMVKEIVGNRIYVIGQVNKPGSYVVNPSVDIVQALSLAGGTTPFASLDSIKIIRRDGAKADLRFRSTTATSQRDEISIKTSC